MLILGVFVHLRRLRMQRVIALLASEKHKTDLVVLVVQKLLLQQHTDAVLCALDARVLVLLIRPVLGGLRLLHARRHIQ